MLTETEFINELTNTKLEIKNETLKAVANELHDNIGQMLTLLKIQSSTLNESNFKTKKDELINAVNDTISELKMVQNHLKDGLKEDVEVFKNLKTQLKRIKQIPNLNLNIDIDFNLIENLDFNKKIILSRVIQEFINNSLKYSRCNTIDAKIIKEHDNIHISLSDNGIGFDEQHIKLGNGIKNIRQRLDIINANYNLKSEIDKGTSLNITILQK